MADNSFTSVAVLSSAERDGCPFSLQNIPFGVFSVDGGAPTVGTAVGDYVLDLAAAARAGLFADTTLADCAADVFAQRTLNGFVALGRAQWRVARAAVQDFVRGCRALEGAPREPLFHLRAEAQMHMPVDVGDYTDFYSSKEHATNVGVMFRGAENALNPNWVHMPIAYHGRASSVVVSGTPVVRPRGQTKPGKDDPPVFGASRKLDFELEMAFVVGVGNALGAPVSVDDAEEHIFGVVLMNDWSARDIQAWEYVPLGPFLGKNFGTVISPWVVTLDALEPFRVPGPAQDPAPLPYLRPSSPAPAAYDVELSVSLRRSGAATVLCRSNLRHLYWSFAQQLAHHTVNGCNMRPGDLCGTGTISGPAPESRGSLLELTTNGRDAIVLSDGSELTFVADGDAVVLSGFARNDAGICVGFGECVCPVLPAVE